MFGFIKESECLKKVKTAKNELELENKALFTRLDELLDDKLSLKNIIKEKDTKIFTIENKIKKLEQKIEELEKENNKLKDDNKYLKLSIERIYNPLKNISLAVIGEIQ